MARSTALNAILWDLRTCSRRAVAVMIAEEPEVSEVRRKIVPGSSREKGTGSKVSGASLGAVCGVAMLCGMG